MFQETTGWIVAPQRDENFRNAVYADESTSTVLGALPQLHPEIILSFEHDTALENQIEIIENLINSGVVNLNDAKPLPAASFIQCEFKKFITQHIGELKQLNLNFIIGTGNPSDLLIDEYRAGGETPKFVFMIDRAPSCSLGEFVFYFSKVREYLDDLNPDIISNVFWLFESFSPFVGGIGTPNWFLEDDQSQALYVLSSLDDSDEDDVFADSDELYEFDELEARTYFQERAPAIEVEVLNPEWTAFDLATKEYAGVINPCILDLLEHINEMAIFASNDLSKAEVLDTSYDRKIFPLLVPIIEENGAVEAIVNDRNGDYSAGCSLFSTQIFITDTASFFEKLPYSLKAISMLDKLLDLLNRLPV